MGGRSRLRLGHAAAQARQDASGRAEPRINGRLVQLLRIRSPDFASEQTGQLHAASFPDAGLAGSGRHLSFALVLAAPVVQVGPGRGGALRGGRAAALELLADHVSKTA